MTEAELYMEYKGVYIQTHSCTPESLKHYEEFSFRPCDVLIVTYPRSGTSWMREIIPLIQSGGDPASVETLYSWDRVPFLEDHHTHYLKFDQLRPSPRIFATHFHYYMMPPSYFKAKPKVIYIMRNPRDVFSSYFYLHRMASMMVNPGPQSKFLNKFLDGKVTFGSWFHHVKGWLNAENKEHVMYICYEEMIVDLKGSVARIAQFLEKSLDTEVIEKIADKCAFKNMKQNKMSNYSAISSDVLDQSKSEFLRKGIAGDWKNLLTVAEAELFDAVYEDKMKGVEYKFTWD